MYDMRTCFSWSILTAYTDNMINNYYINFNEPVSTVDGPFR